MAATYLDRIEEMRLEVSSMPFLEIFDFQVNPPANYETLAKVDELLGVPLHDSVRKFYQQLNGFKFRWGLRQDLSNDAREKVVEQYNDYDLAADNIDNTEANSFAFINIQSLEESILQDRFPQFDFEWNEQPYDFNGQTYRSCDLVKRIKPFDIYSLYQGMGFFIEEKNANPLVFMLDDYYIAWQDSRLTYFDSYLEMLFATRGIVAARDKIYGDYPGHLKPILETPKAFWTVDKIPLLFRHSET